MLLSDPPKLVQPRDHKAKVCVWADLSVNDCDMLQDAVSPDQVREVLAAIFKLDDYKENLKAGILLDLYFYTVQFAQESGFSKDQLSAFFSIVKKTHEVCIETPFGNVQHTFSYFKELVLRHAVQRPPYSIELFTSEQVRRITEYIINTYFRHLKMYKYVFTPLVKLDLSMTYVGVPVTPEPSEAGEAEGVEDLPEEGEIPISEGEAVQPKEQPEPELSPAAKELKALIEMHLSDELKRLRSSVDEQLKNTEEVLNKKIDAIEGGNKSGKGGRGSSRGKKK